MDLLTQAKLFEVSNLYEWAKIFITPEVLNEIHHFHLKSCNFQDTTILTIKNPKIFQEAKILNFDQADAEILSNGGRNPDTDVCIVSEDKPLLSFAMAYSLTAMQVIDVFQLLNNLGLINNRKIFQINRFLREKKNITHKKAMDIKKWLNKQ